MTKWFDTNYHYLVPEIGPSTTFTLHPGKVLAELKEALGQGIPARPVIIGPITFLLLSKAVDGAGRRSNASKSWFRSIRSCCRCLPTAAPSGCSSTSRRW